MDPEPVDNAVEDKSKPYKKKKNKNSNKFKTQVRKPFPPCSCGKYCILSGPSCIQEVNEDHRTGHSGHTNKPKSAPTTGGAAAQRDTFHVQDGSTSARLTAPNQSSAHHKNNADTQKQEASQRKPPLEPEPEGKTEQMCEGYV
jgi:hypothetical protein